MPEMSETEPRRRGKGRPFQKGQSGNPGGRPKGEAEVRALAQALGPEAIDGLYAIAKHPKTPAAVRVTAWDKLLDRGFGRPPQALPTGDDGAALAWRR